MVLPCAYEGQSVNSWPVVGSESPGMRLDVAEFRGLGEGETQGKSV